MVSKIPYPASLSRSRKEEHETLEEELLELEVSSQDGLRKKILKLSPKDAYIVLLNTLVGLNLGDEDQKGVGNFIHHLLSEVRGTEDGDPPVYDVFSEAPAGRNQCREDWFKWYRKKFQK